MAGVITGTQSQRAIEVLGIRENKSSRMYTYNNKYSEQGAIKVLGVKKKSHSTMYNNSHSQVWI